MNSFSFFEFSFENIMDVLENLSAHLTGIGRHRKSSPFFSKEKHFYREKNWEKKS